MNWYLLYAKAAAERWAAANLENQGIETCLPLEKVLKRNGVGRTKSIERAYFPRYLFARFALEDSGRAVRGTRGVARIVTFADEPAVVAEDVIEEIRSALSAGQGFMQRPGTVGLTVDCPFTAGDYVRVCEGPGAGMTGVFQRWIPEKQRVMVLLEFLGRRTPVPMSPGAIEPLTFEVWDADRLA